MTDIDSDTLRKSLGAFATGVTVVTARDPAGNAVGMTVNSFTAVSLEPPLVLWSVARGVGPVDAFSTASHYAVHVLHADQEALADHFARDRDDKFADIPFTNGIAGLPLLDDFTARFQCRVEQRLDGGDHVMLLGRVLALDHRPGEPLIFHAGGYRRLSI
ncbi:flavin reductase family protein [Aquisalimonas sp.]|uniref:flavin reductase family protein n=1 Tax=Aquisalimonas sp. TaxID=1872621 RepID=UPI0025C6D6AD|nr:flavin reductase family protein [Aquisalimonas sp.]